MDVTCRRVIRSAAVVVCGVFLNGQTAPAQFSQSSNLPTNMDVARNMSRTIEVLYAASPTFRAQCDRLASAKNLRIVVRLHTAMPSQCRAFTIIRRHGSELRADVHVPPGRALIELVAHELEHVLEQIEGLDLRRLARMRATGVREVERDLFETDRAQRAGRTVAEESTRPTAGRKCRAGAEECRSRCESVPPEPGRGPSPRTTCQRQLRPRRRGWRATA